MLVGETSFHLHSIGARVPTRSALSGDRTVDVCIVGAGFTGLWTAWWLREARPDQSILVVEAKRVGFGASGRNLGWLSGKPVGHRERLAEGSAGAERVIALRRACIEAVSEIPELMRSHGIDIDAAHGGYLQVARTLAGLERVRRTVADRASWCLGEADIHLLNREEVLERVNIAGVLGGLYSPHCARIQPAKLVTGLARLVEAHGVDILEQTAATRISPGAVETEAGIIHAHIILRATEAYSCRLPGHGRSIIPMRSCVVATEPLTQVQWEAIGWRNCEGLFGSDHLSFFGTRTADGRILMGGAGFPYRYASGTDRNGEVDRSTADRLATRIKSLFPSIDPTIAHAWSGVFGTPRDWSPSVSFDRAAGIGHAGGYAGQGVAASYLAGRTLADLVTDKDSRWTRLPWTNRVSPQWEREPVRWVGARAVYGLYRAADAIEKNARSGRTSLLAKLAAAINSRP